MTVNNNTTYKSITPVKRKLFSVRVPYMYFSKVGQFLNRVIH